MHRGAVTYLEDGIANVVGCIGSLVPSYVCAFFMQVRIASLVQWFFVLKTLCVAYAIAVFVLISCTVDSRALWLEVPCMSMLRHSP